MEGMPIKAKIMFWLIATMLVLLIIYIIKDVGIGLW